MPNLQVPHNLSTSAQYASDGTNDSALALATDKVGVGTASPVEQLHVASDSNHAILLSRANGSYGFRIHRDASAGVVRLQIRNEVPDWETKIQIGEGVTDESLLLNPDNEGKVGIGTVYPQERLDVNGSIAIRVENGNYRVGTTRKVFNVLDYGAVADGTTDCCAAFQCALDAAKSAGGGIVYVPRGVYKIGAYLEIGNNVILEGESIGIGCLSTVEISEMVDRKEGSILLAYDESRPFITLTEGRNAAVKGIAVFYPDQAISGTLEDPSYLKEYPFCICSYTANPSIINVTLVNPYRGIFITNAGRYLIDGVWGQPLLQGLEIQACVASSRIRNVQFEPVWSDLQYAHWYAPYPNGVQGGNLKKVKKFQMTRAVAVTLKQSDAFVFENFFCTGYNKAFVFSGLNNDTQSWEGASGVLSNIQFEGCPYGFYINRQTNIQINNFSILSDFGQPFDTANYDNEGMPAGKSFWHDASELNRTYGVFFEGTAGEEATVKLVNGTINCFDYGVYWKGFGEIHVSECTFSDSWEYYQSSLGRYFGYRGFYIEKGSATVVGCRFNYYIYDSDPHAAIERNTAGALTLIGNMTNNFDTGGEGGGVYHACRILGVEAEHSLHGDLEVRGSKWNAAGDKAVVRFGAAGDDNGIAVVYGGPAKWSFVFARRAVGVPSAVIRWMR